MTDRLATDLAVCLLVLVVVAGAAATVGGYAQVCAEVYLSYDVAVVCLNVYVCLEIE